MPAPVSNSARSAGRVAVSEAAPPPDPGFLEGFGAAFTSARNDQPGRIRDAQVEAYAPLMIALDKMGVNSSQFILPVRSGPQLNFDGIWSQVDEVRRRDPAAFKDVPRTQAEFETQWRNNFRERAEKTEAIAARAGFGTRLAGGFAASFTDPINVATLPLGGVGKSMLMRVATEALVNGAIEAASQPFINIERQGQGRREMTGEQMAINVASAAAFGGAVRGGIEGAPALGRQIGRAADAGHGALGRVMEANRDRVPQALRDRWDAHLLAKANPLDDPVLLSDLSEALIGQANLSDLERSAIVVLRREGSADAGNPFMQNGAGTDLHDALMDEALKSAFSANPMATSRTAIAMAARSAGQTREAGSSFMRKVRGAESDGDDAAANPRSSARGRYQFTNGTWLRYYTRRYGDGGLSKSEILAKKGDGNLQEVLMRDLTADNAAILARAGHAANDGNLYLAHFAGPEGATKLLDADADLPASRVLEPKAIKANPFLRDMKVRDVIAWAHRKMGTSAGDAGVRVRSDIASDTETAALQSSLDEALGRAANLAEEHRRAALGEDDPLASALDASAAPIERLDMPESSAAPLEARSLDADAPRAEVLAVLPQLRDVIAGRQSLNKVEALAKDLGVSEPDLRAAMGEMVREGRVSINRKTGHFMRKPRAPDGPEDVLEFIARNGGIRDDEGHSLGLRGISERERRELHPAAIKNVKRKREGGGKRDWQRMTRRNGVLLRHEGRSVDAIGEILWESGYLRGAESERPTTREVLEYLDQRINSGEAAYPVGEMPAPRTDGADVPDPWTISHVDPFGFERTPAEIQRLTLERDDARAALIDLGFAENAFDPVALGDVLHNLSFTDAKLPIADRLVHAVNMMADDVQANAFAHSQDMDYDWIDYDWPSSPRSDADGESRAAAPDFSGREPVAGASTESDVRGELLREGESTAGEQLARLTPAERTPFLDPDSPATHAQADSLLHDARAAEEAASAFRDIWKDKGFQKALKDIGDVAHRESPVAADHVAGWRAAETGDMTRFRALVGEISASTSYIPHGFNPRQSYLESFYARVTGKPTEVRAIGGVRVNKAGKRVIDANQALRELEALDADHAAARGIPDESGQLDFAAPTRAQARTALEMQGQGRAKSRSPQKAPGSDGGLFDVHAHDATFRFTDDGEEASLREILDGFDAESAELKNIRDCL